MASSPLFSDWKEAQINCWWNASRVGNEINHYSGDERVFRRRRLDATDRLIIALTLLALGWMIGGQP